jgi:hypothetical protein
MMKNRFLSSALMAGAFALGCFVSQANAAMVINTQDITDLVAAPPAPVNLPFASENIAGIITPQTVSIGGVTRSPFENANGTAGFGYGNTYTNIASGGSGIWNFSASDNFSIFWGSPDSYNKLEFFSAADGGGASLGSFTGTDLNIQSLGHDLVTFVSNGGFFQSVVLSSLTGNAFEFTNLVASCEEGCGSNTVPLPGALPLFVSGMFGVGGLLGWRKRRKATKAQFAAA